MNEQCYIEIINIYKSVITGLIATIIMCVVMGGFYYLIWIKKP